jgi:hypothetical protein
MLGAGVARFEVAVGDGFLDPGVFRREQGRVFQQDGLRQVAAVRRQPGR